MAISIGIVIGFALFLSPMLIGLLIFFLLIRKLRGKD